MDNSIDPSNAAKKPWTTNPGTSLATSKNIRAFITKVNSPNVSKLIGSVKIIKRGLINILTSPTANAAHSAGTNPARLIPGTTQATKSNAKAKSSQVISKSIILFPLVLNDLTIKDNHEYFITLKH